MSALRLSICIISHNRRADTLTATGSALSQDRVPIEVRVYDNGSTDGTAEAIREHFPAVHVRTLENNVGASRARNLALQESRAPYVLFLDDDAYFTDSHTAAAALEFLDEHPKVGAVALPFVEPLQRRMAVWVPPAEFEREGHCRIRGFVACACAVRREAALAIGGFREAFHQWGEERDFCIRMMQAGLVIEYIRAPPMVHLGSAKRNRNVMEWLGVRNTLLFDWMNIPLPWMPARLLADSFRLFTHRLSLETARTRFLYVTRAWIELQAFRTARRPVSATTYRQFRSLPAHGPIAALDSLPSPCIPAV